MVKNCLFRRQNSPQKSILTLVLVVWPMIGASEGPKTLDLANPTLSEIFFDGKTPQELLCLQAFDACEQEFNQVMSLIPKENISLKEQLIQAKVTTLYTIRAIDTSQGNHSVYYSPIFSYKLCCQRRCFKSSCVIKGSL